MKRITVVLLSAMFLTLTSCKPTPESPIVQGKNLDRLIEKAGDGLTGNEQPIEVDLAQRLGVPERYISQRINKKKKLTLNADAEITLPDYAMPVIRVEPDDFSQELSEKLYYILTGDTPMYEEQTELTKSQIQHIISGIEDEIAYLKPFIERGVPTPPGTIEEMEKQIKELRQKYETAPEEIALIPAVPEIKTRNSIDREGKKNGEFTGFYATEKPGLFGTDKGKKFYVMNNSKTQTELVDDNGDTVRDTAYIGASVFYSNEGLVDYHIMGDENQRPAKSLIMNSATLDDYADSSKITSASDVFNYKEAVDMAEKFLADAGIEDMKIKEMGLSHVFPNELFSSDEFYEGKTSKDDVDFEAINKHEEQLMADIRAGKYDSEILDVQVSIAFERYYKGVPVSVGGEYDDVNFGERELVETEDFTTGSGAMQDSFIQNWSYENFSMTLCNKGILIFGWYSPYTLTETVTDDSEMISFNDAVDIFESTFRIKYDQKDFNRNGEVVKATLSLRRIMEQGGGAGKGLFVPVWDFYGSITPLPNPSGIIISDGGNAEDRVRNLMTVNAVDGTIIDLAKGY
jgi:hypothetical protein